ncbi:STAS domain-containing protein [Aeoliella sp. ICT_H6.2]|uniref:STAS domain-containing protein n=1 Tax=Aeoliella straminimaris TaxID=2954799 RepID=A0A9X2FBK4_9BACT|nr:STAS domain-containing protein [Aeoliella straminimaris]MCO6045082.1 STAS domain-containing protein [Aeoliella straminimaris]
MEGQKRLTDDWQANLYERSGWQVVELVPAGDVTGDAYLLAGAVWDVVADWRPPRMIVELHQVTFMGSSMMGALVRVLKRASMAGGELRLCGLLPHPREAMQACRLHLVFSIYDNVDQATQYSEQS